MTGQIYKRKDTGAWYVQWYDTETKRQIRIYRYRDEKMFSKSTARKLRSQMQGDVENGTFKLEKYTKKGWTAVIPMIGKWKKTKFKKLKPATRDAYEVYLKNWIIPFFKKKPYQLEEVKLDILYSLLDSIEGRSGKYKQNVMFCFHAFMKFCWRSEKIVAVPPFPEKGDYDIIKRKIRWLPEYRQMAIIDKIPAEHQPIFLFLKYHVRRPAEACALYKIDYNRTDTSFFIRRSISARKMVDSTKTGEIHHIPCHSAMIDTIEALIDQNEESPFMFVNPCARRDGKRYTNEALNIIWKRACKAAGEDIDLYSGLKHSSCSQFINEKGLSIHDVQAIGDWKRLDSVEHYAETEVARKRELMETPTPSDRLRIVKN